MGKPDGAPQLKPHRWQKGMKSPNPKGRPPRKSFEEEVRDLLAAGDNFCLKMLARSLVDEATINASGNAMRILSERLWPVVKELSITPGRDLGASESPQTLENLDEADREALKRLAHKALGAGADPIIEVEAKAVAPKKGNGKA